MSTQIEPSANMRMMAHMARELYVALVEQGFSTDQSFVLCKEMWIAQARGSHR